LKIWITRDPNTEATNKTSTYETGTYTYFDVNTWEKHRKDLVLYYDQLDEISNKNIR